MELTETDENGVLSSRGPESDEFIDALIDVICTSKNLQDDSEEIF